MKKRLIRETRSLLPMLRDGEPKRNESRFVAVLFAAGALFALSNLFFVTETMAESKYSATAIAQIQSCSDNEIGGFATLQERATTQGVKQVDVYLQVYGLTYGDHAVHIHETGLCAPCSEAKGHFDPGNFSETNPDANHPFHAGDLVNINSDGLSALLTTQTSRVTLSGGPLSLFDADGSAFIIHDNVDTFCPEGAVAGCAGGSRAACGIIKMVERSENYRLMVSKSSSRHNGVELTDAELNNRAYVYLSPSYPKESIDNVAFYFDGRRQKVEYYAPYDFSGTHGYGNAAEFPTWRKANGTHSIAAVVTFSSGEQTYVTSEFTIDNDRHRFGNGGDH